MTFSVVLRPSWGTRPGRPSLPATHVPTPEPRGPEVDGWTVVREGLSEEEALETAAELNLASDILET